MVCRPPTSDHLAKEQSPITWVVRDWSRASRCDPPVDGVCPRHCCSGEMGKWVALYASPLSSIPRTLIFGRLFLLTPAVPRQSSSKPSRTWTQFGFAMKDRMLRVEVLAEDEWQAKLDELLPARSR